jgi:hypothetical protein
MFLLSRTNFNLNIQLIKEEITIYFWNTEVNELKKKEE